MVMQQQPQRERQLAPMREAAIARLREGMLLVTKYREELRKVEIPGLPVEQDEIDTFIEKEIFPFFVGPPGRVCEECGGSGRKKG